MVNEKLKVDNKAKEKSKKKKDPQEVKILDLKTTIEGVEFGGKQISGEADSLAAAKKIEKIVKKVIKNAEGVVKPAFLRQWCEHTHNRGAPPDMRRAVSEMSAFKVVQQTPTKVTRKKVDEAKKKGVDLISHSSKKNYNISLGNASSEQRKAILANMKQVLGEDYDNVVSEEWILDEVFFDSFQEIVRKTLTDDEDLLEKMVSILATIAPTIQFSDFETDLPDKDAFGLASEAFRIDAELEAAQKEAAKAAKEAEKERKRIEKEKAKEEKKRAREEERARKKAEKEAEKARKKAEKEAKKAREKAEKAAERAKAKAEA